MRRIIAEHSVFDAVFQIKNFIADCNTESSYNIVCRVNIFLKSGKKPFKRDSSNGSVSDSEIPSFFNTYRRLRRSLLILSMIFSIDFVVNAQKGKF